MGGVQGNFNLGLTGAERGPIRAKYQLEVVWGLLPVGVRGRAMPHLLFVRIEQKEWIRRLVPLPCLGVPPMAGGSGRATFAPRLLADCKQEVIVSRTLYIRHVPDDVAERLEQLARRAGLPLSTFALQELCETSRRADNADLLQALPSATIEPGAILEALRQSRAER
jgi:hypothetical protein